MKRIDLLQQTFNHFQYAAQWIATDPSNYSGSLKKAESLVEFLEIQDCGSVGGFDKLNKVEKVTEHSLYNRFLTVIRKENTYDDLKDECGFTPLTLGEFYDSVSKLRTEILNQK